MTTSSSGSTIDGLISGLNTTDLITKLMSVEAQPQANLKTKVTTEQTAIAAYQSVNAAVATMQTAAQALTSTTAWSAVTATSSSPAVSATASLGASAGTSSFDVTQLAKAQVSTFTVSDASMAVVDGGGLSITVGPAGTATPVTVTTNTVQGVADAINGTSGLGVRATVVTTSDGNSVLQLSARKSGTANSFTVTGLVAAGTTGVVTPLTDVVSSADAKIVFGGTDSNGVVNPGGYTASSSTNTFSGVIAGVTFTATSLATDVSISVTSDAQGISDKVKAMVDAANAVVDEISKQSAYDTTTKAGMPLTGDFTVRQLGDNILSAAGTGTSGYGSYAQLGVQLDQTGHLTFDSAAFLTAYAADPDTVKSVISRSADSTTTPAVTAGLASALAAVGKSATDFVSGNLTTAIQGGNAMITDLNTQISSWDIRLASRQAALQLQYSNLELALGKLKDQSTWLSGQVASLPTGG